MDTTNAPVIFSSPIYVKRNLFVTKLEKLRKEIWESGLPAGVDLPEKYLFAMVVKFSLICGRTPDGHTFLVAGIPFVSLLVLRY